AFIGNVHRRGATEDNLARLVAGCFTRNPEKNKETAKAWDVDDESRVYASYKEMADAESAREDGIDFVTIVTPTDSHYEIAKYFLERGIHVVCDKPVTVTVEEAMELKAIAEEKDLLIGVTYTYGSYHAVQQGRAMIDHGDIGKILNIVAEYPQDWVIVQTVAENSDQATWRLDPVRSGGTACISDIGTHLEALVSRMTGLKMERVIARFTGYEPASTLDHDIQVLAQYEGGVPGMLWASQIASGSDCAVKVRVYGEKGSIEWSHLHPMELIYAPLNQPVRTITANREYNSPECVDLCRLPAGHPEGFYQAFANIYKAYCISLIAKKEGREDHSLRYFTIEDGIESLKFVKACVESNAKGSIWVDL
ncbi:MAG: Gfo/Idh/MocA family oxidoreductase, partial [Lachnospiraceae bacterium]|nr:Gfo/Idh/MocA family oxidoreductase [Lachnospiraceae bacterium]